MTVRNIFAGAAKAAAALPIAFVGSQSGGADQNFALGAVPLPAGLQAGDMVVVVAVSSGDLNDFVVAGPATISTSGYEQRAAADLQYLSTRVFTKVMGPTPDTSVSVTSNNSTARTVLVQAWRNVNASTPMDVTPTTVMSGGSSVINSPVITPVSTGAVIITTGAGLSDAQVVPTAPAGYTNALTRGQNTANTYNRCVIASKQWGGSGSEDPNQWVGNYLSSNAITLALRPAS